MRECDACGETIYESCSGCDADLCVEHIIFAENHNRNCISRIVCLTKKCYFENCCITPTSTMGDHYSCTKHLNESDFRRIRNEL